MEENQAGDIPREEAEETAPEIEKAVEDEPTSDKRAYVALAIVAGIFLLLILSFKGFNSLTGAQVVTLEGLHEKNLQGKLEEEQGYVYNGVSFVKFAELWNSEIPRGGRLLQVPLHFSPRELENITKSGELDDSFKKEEMYVVFDPLVNDKFTTLAASELSTNIAMGIGFQPIAACDKNETDACRDRPIVTCENRDKAVLQLIQNETGPRIEFDKNCVKLIGQGINLVKAENRFIYMWYQVMD